MTTTPFTIETVRFAEAEDDLRAVRDAVFVREQSVSPAEEWDALDAECLHALARDRDGTPIGTARLVPGGKIGRLAVRKRWRGQGVGGALLTTLIDHARSTGIQRLEVDAQVRAVPFYERHGFTAYGGVFLDAGITHRKMSREL